MLKSKMKNISSCEVPVLVVLTLLALLVMKVMVDIFKDCMEELAANNEMAKNAIH